MGWPREKNLKSANPSDNRRGNRYQYGIKRTRRRDRIFRGAKSEIVREDDRQSETSFGKQPERTQREGGRSREEPPGGAQIHKTSPGLVRRGRVIGCERDREG